MKKFNPFIPNSPVYTGMFAGREREIQRIDKLLFQTKSNNPTHILIQGERGIGKTSLLLVAKNFAKGTLSLEEEKYNFLTAQITINHDTTLIDLVKKINDAIQRSLSHDEIYTKIKSIWEFIKKFEVGGFRIRNSEKIDQNELIDKTIYSIIDTVKAITEDSTLSGVGLRQKKDGLVLLIDEVDNASKELNIGTFIKNLSETLVQEDVNKVLLILSGLPKMRDILRESHESSLRLFEEFKLTTLSKEEANSVIISGLEVAGKDSNPITINADALDLIYIYSEGYPHFIQQIGYSVLEFDKDDVIDLNDVDSAMLQPNGALDLIGDRYYKDMYYKKIKEDSYRQILNIMAEHANKWISKKEISKNFTGKRSTLDNGILALKKRNIILSKEGRRGLYRLQWIGFAIWINIINKRSTEKK